MSEFFYLHTNHFVLSNYCCVVFVVLCLLFSACNTTQYLAESEFLYDGAKVIIEKESFAGNAKSITSDLNGLISPKPNQKLFRLFRTKLWIHYRSLIKPKGLNRFLVKRYSEEPVIFQTAAAQKNIRQIENYLFNRGFFDAEARYDTIQRNKLIKVNYVVSPHHQYKYEQIVFKTDSSSLGSLVKSREKETLLKPGAYYDSEMLTQERNRIYRQARQAGYFDYIPEAITYKADSSKTNHNIRLTVKPLTSKDGEPYRPYRLNRVFVYPEYSALYTDAVGADTLVYENYYFITSLHEIRPAALADKMLFKKGSLFSQRNYEYTLNHLLQLDLFKFVDIRFQKVPTDTSALLDTYVYLTPDSRREVQVEAETNTVEGYLGTLLNLSFRDKNRFRGAEAFSLNLGTGIETPLGQTFIHTFEINGQAKLQVPKLLVPFKMGKISRYFIPFTNFSVGYSFARRLQQYNIGLANFNFIYDWKASRTAHHLFTPAFLNFVQLISADSAFLVQLDQNPIQKRSFTNQLIFGSNYTYFFSNAPIGGKVRNYTYFKSSLELTGNLAYLISRLANTEKHPYQLLNVPFAQYMRLDFDLRRYVYLNQKGSQSIITRFVAGIGIPYGNSSVLPYVKQFFTGGSNDLRAFRLRSIGPGNSTSFDTDSNTGNFDRTGDVKLASNVEYRFSLNSYLKGALFTDFGNVWLYKGDDQSKFRWSQFYRQFAIGTGIGARIDLSFFVLRLDWAFPLHSPVDGWVVKDAQPFKKDWRKDNIVWNLAIGYPF